MLIEGVVVEKGRRSSIDLEPHADNLVVEDVTIRSCELEQLGTSFAAGGRGDVSNVTISDILSHGRGGVAIVFDSAGLMRRRNWSISRLTVDRTFGSPVAPLRFIMVDDITIRDVIMPISPGQSRKVARFDNCGGTLTITDCDFSPGGCEIEAINGSPTPTTSNNVTVCP